MTDQTSKCRHRITGYDVAAFLFCDVGVFAGGGTLLLALLFAAILGPDAVAPGAGCVLLIAVAAALLGLLVFLGTFVVDVVLSVLTWMTGEHTR